MKTWKKITIILCAAAFTALPLLALAVNYAEWAGNSTAGLGSAGVTGGGTGTGVSYGGSARVGGNVIIDGILTPQTLAPVAASNFFLTATAVALTSPTVTFTATNRQFITISSDANQTAVRPVDGTTGQIIIIAAANGLGTNTIQFDDATTDVSLGANRVLTEGNNSNIVLLCTAGGAGTASDWAQLNYNAN